jgi:uncharacterized protein (UPF0261 family)
MKRRHVLFFVVAVAIPFLLVLMAGIFAHMRLLGRHLTPLFPFLLALMACGLARLLEKPELWRKTIALATLGVFLFSAVEIRLAPRFQRDDYRSASAVAREAIHAGQHVWWLADVSTGVIDVTTHELTDLIVDGVYSAGDTRLTAAGAAGLPQVVVPGAIDHSNFWAGQVPARFQDREFFRYNAQNLLMRTNAEEYRNLGAEFARRLNAARGPVHVLIPLAGFSEHTKRRACDLNGNDRGPWKRPDDYRIFVDALKPHLQSAQIEELPLHINDARFAQALVQSFREITP